MEKSNIAILLSFVATISSGYLTYKSSEQKSVVDSRLGNLRLDLERQISANKHVIDSGQLSLERYSFIKDIIEKITSNNAQNREPNKVLASFVLTDEEYEKFLNSLISSSSSEEVKSFGKEAKEEHIKAKNQVIGRLVAKIGLKDKKIRFSAIDELLKRFNSNPVLISETLDYLENSNPENGTARINGIYILNRMEVSAWNSELIESTRLISIKLRKLKESGKQTKKNLDLLDDKMAEAELRLSE